MNFADILCFITGLLWGYFFFPVFFFARIMADFVAEGRMLDASRWEKQSPVWKATLILGLVFIYLIYIGVGAMLMQGYQVWINPPPIIGQKLWSLGFFAGFLIYGALTRRSTRTRRKRRAS